MILALTVFMLAQVAPPPPPSCQHQLGGLSYYANSIKGQRDQAEAEIADLRQRVKELQADLDAEKAKVETKPAAKPEDKKP